MTLFLFAVCIVLGLFVILQKRQYVRLSRELQYVDERLRQIADADGRSPILVPSDHPGIRVLSADLNRVLERWERDRADYERARGSMKRMLTNISHDLRTPLTVLQGYGELLQAAAGQENGAAKLSEAAEKICEKSKELVDTMNAWFSLAKLESGDGKLTPERTDVTKLCHEVLLSCCELLESRGFQVELQTPSVPVFALADSDGLRRILRNLVDNAVKYAEDGKYLALRLWEEDAAVSIELEDHGPGIPSEEREQIFTRAYTGGRGSGLGLAIAKTLALQMGGDIRVIDAEAGGTRFAVTLPKKS